MSADTKSSIYFDKSYDLKNLEEVITLSAFA
jgi:hypothetical protein